MKYEQVVKNINKLLRYWHFTFSDLANETEISLTGIKKMMDSGYFKLESLEKIATSLKVPLITLLAEKISMTEDIYENESYVVTIHWSSTEVYDKKIDLPNFKKFIGCEGELLLNVIHDSDYKNRNIDEDTTTWRERYEKLIQEYDKQILELNEAGYDLLKTKQVLSLAEKKIQFQDETLTSYKEQNESFRLINEQLRETIKNLQNNKQSSNQ